jgi:hypothetical protein
VGFLIVLAIAVTVGVLVYRLTDGGEPTAEPIEDTAFATGSSAPVAGRPSDVEEWAGGEVEPPHRGTPAGAPRRVELSPEAGSIPVVGVRPSWHSRLNGAMGLIVAVGLGAIAIAGALYLAGSMVARLISGST